MDVVNDNNNTTESSDFMPPAALVEKEREQYYSDLEAYFIMLKKLGQAEAKKIARKNLIKTGIIDKKGNLTDRYASSRKIDNNE